MSGGRVMTVKHTPTINWSGGRMATLKHIFRSTWYRIFIAEGMTIPEYVPNSQEAKKRLTNTCRPLFVAERTTIPEITPDNRRVRQKDGSCVAQLVNNIGNLLVFVRGVENAHRQQ